MREGPASDDTGDAALQAEAAAAVTVLLGAPAPLAAPLLAADARNGGLSSCGGHTALAAEPMPSCCETLLPQQYQLPSLH